jgi:uncharacterized iron-regulated membrane protein
LLYALHKWTGLTIGLNVLFFSLTATYMLSVDILASDQNAEHKPLLDRSTRVPIQPLIDRLATHYGDHHFVPERVTYAALEGDEDEIRIELDGTHLRFAADPRTGFMRLAQGTLPAGVAPYEEIPPGGATREKATGQEPLYARLNTLILRLHSSLGLGIVGSLMTGIVGVVLLVSTITGWIIYSPFMKGLLFGMFRRNNNVRFRLADLHKFVGLGALSFNLVMAVTGIGLTLGLFAIQMQVRSDLRTIESRAGKITPADPLPDIDTVYAAAQSTYPQHTILRIEYPGPDALQGDKVFTFFAERTPATPGLVPDIGIVTAEHIPRAEVYPLTWWMNAILLGAPIHTGSFGGRPVYVAYLILSLSSGFLSITGYLMYIIKWRRYRQLKRSRTANTAAPSRRREPRPEQIPAWLGPWRHAGLTIAAVLLGMLMEGPADLVAAVLLLTTSITLVKRVLRN